MIQQIRIARPVADLERSVAMYVRGLGLRCVGSFRDHAGFDGAMLQGHSNDFHLEFTRCQPRPIKPSPTDEDLLVFYIPEVDAWSTRCQTMLDAGFVAVHPTNPYWQNRARTFRDPDGYQVVIHHGLWKTA